MKRIILASAALVAAALIAGCGGSTSKYTGACESAIKAGTMKLSQAECEKGAERFESRGHSENWVRGLIAAE